MNFDEALSKVADIGRHPLSDSDREILRVVHHDVKFDSLGNGKVTTVFSYAESDDTRDVRFIETVWRQGFGVGHTREVRPETRMYTAYVAH
jgi:hypothetical protein